MPEVRVGARGDLSHAAWLVLRAPGMIPAVVARRSAFLVVL